MYDQLESCLRHRNEMVVFEAARAILNLPDVTTKELMPALASTAARAPARGGCSRMPGLIRSQPAATWCPAAAVLQLFLSSPKPTMRFAAIRALNKAAMTHAFAVSACNLDMENLITDPNRSISTLAITTLLKVTARVLSPSPTTGRAR